MPTPKVSRIAACILAEKKDISLLQNPSLFVDIAAGIDGSNDSNDGGKRSVSSHRYSRAYLFFSFWLRTQRLLRHMHGIPFRAEYWLKNDTVWVHCLLHDTSGQAEFAGAISKGHISYARLSRAKALQCTPPYRSELYVNGGKIARRNIVLLIFVALTLSFAVEAALMHSQNLLNILLHTCACTP